jgi:hypothetical protein
MSNPTTPFSWQMPTATDLVTDLPADFEVFGQAVATSLADLLGGTTGQVLAKASNTDMDFVWSADAAGMTNPMTTTGDTIYSSSGSTPARLAIGSTGNVLTVAGGVPTWAAPAAGGKVLQVIQGTTTTNVNVASTSFTDTGLSATITPSSASSKVLVIFNQSSAISRSMDAQGASLQLLKNASVVYSQDGAGGGFNSFYLEISTLSSPKGISSYFFANGTFLDSPATTSAITYKTQGRCVDTANSGQVRFQPNAATSTITLMEIGA